MYRQSAIKTMVVGEAIGEDDHTVEFDFIFSNLVRMIAPRILIAAIILRSSPSIET
jgi:hypothetical protein